MKNRKQEFCGLLGFLYKYTYIVEIMFQVMVGIYNNGVEKANIIFDARNSDKMNWFRPERIISSTWNDIRYSPSNIFRLSGCVFKY